MSEIYLSYTDGELIAMVPESKKMIYLYDESKLGKKKCCKKCSERCKKREGGCCGGCCYFSSCSDDELNEDDFDLINAVALNKNLTRSQQLEIELMKDRIRRKDRGIRTDVKYNDLKRCLSKLKPKEIVLNSSESLQPIPDTKTRQVCYVAGASGSGKSTWISNYAKQYHKLFPKNKIFVFSRVEEDKCIDKLKCTRIIMDEQLIEDPIHPEELADSLVIFDDTDTIPDKNLKNALNDLKRDVLEIGRHSNIYVCITSHMLTNYKETRTILNEAHLIVFFPSSGSSYQIGYMLKNYFGLDSKQIDRIMKLPSRWVCAKRNYPQLIMYERGIYLLS